MSVKNCRKLVVRREESEYTSLCVHTYAYLMATHRNIQQALENNLGVCVYVTVTV